MYIWLAIFLSFAALFVLNLAASAAAVGVWHLLAPLTKNWTATRRAKFIFALRFYPFLGSLIFVLAFLLRAYLLFEPYNTKELITFKLAAPAFISAVGIVFAAYRLGGSYWKTRRLVDGWLKDAEAISLRGVKIPIYRIRHPFPLIAVVGVFSPKMFVAHQIFDSLDEKEFRAAVAHECGHLAAHDNLKRILLSVCRDMLVFPFARKLDSFWAESIEAAADEYAVQTEGNMTAVELASAIVKIARIAPENARPAMLAGASMLTEKTGDVSRRVQSLLRLSDTNILRSKLSSLSASFPIYFCVLALTVFFAVNYKLLRKIHGVMENVVHVLQ